MMEGYFNNQIPRLDFPRVQRTPDAAKRWYRDERGDYCERPEKKPRFPRRETRKKIDPAPAPRDLTLSHLHG